jgi:uncharacterized protein YbjT (DUF2867 family)
MEAGKNVVVITGATGRQGSATVRELLARNHKVRAVTRRPDSDAAKDLARLGAEVVRGDFNEVGSLERALAGGWGLFSLQNTWEAGVDGEEEQGKRLADVARKAGIQHLVYTSVASAHRRTGIPHFENKKRIEDHVKGLGFPSYTILRPVFFMENLTSPWFLPAIQQGSLAVGVEPTTRLQMIAVRDIGKYAALAFENHAQLNGREIDIAGDELTMPETAQVLSRTTGHPVAFVRVPIEEVRKASADFATMLEWFDRVGYDVDIPKTSRESGVVPTRFADWAKAAAWGPTAAAL